jgi:thymidylate kinase
MNSEFTRQKPQQNNDKTVKMARRGRPVTVDRSYMQDAYAQKWLMGLSENTKGNYAKYFLEWLTFIKLNPKQQIQKRLSDTKSNKIEARTFFESKFREYKEVLEKQKSYSWNCFVVFESRG